MVLAVILVFALKTILTEAQVPFPGGCPDVKVMQNFDVNKYLGKWYEQRRYFAIFEAGGICVTAHYADKGNGIIRVNHTEYNTLTDSYSMLSGVAKQIDKGTLGVKFRSAGGFQAPYSIVGTDYTSYAVVWSCADVFFIGNLQFAWVLTRQKHPNEETLSRIERVLSSSHLSTKAFRNTPQTCTDN